MEVGDDLTTKWAASLVGKTVVLSGLSRDDLNGRTGRAISWDAAKGRVGVELERKGEPAGKVGRKKDAVAVKPTNLRLPDDDLEPALPVALFDELLDEKDFEVLRRRLLEEGSRPGTRRIVAEGAAGEAPSLAGRAESRLRLIVEIVRNAADETPLLVQQACDALVKVGLGGVPRKRSVCAAGAAPALVDLLGSPLGANAAVARSACHALANLANGDARCKLGVADAGGAASLVAALRTHSLGDAVAPTRAAGAGGEAAGSAGGAGSETAEAEAAASADVRAAGLRIAQVAVGGIANLAAGDTSCVRAVLNAWGLPTMLRAMAKFSDAADVAADGCLGLANLCAGRGEGASAVVDEGGLNVLVAALRTHGRKEARVREWAIAALTNLASDGTSRWQEALVEVAAASAVVESVGRSSAVCERLVKKRRETVKSPADMAGGLAGGLPDIDAIEADLDLSRRVMLEARSMRHALTFCAHVGRTPDGRADALAAGFAEAVVRVLLLADEAEQTRCDTILLVEDACRAAAAFVFGADDGRAALLGAAGGGIGKALTLAIAHHPTEKKVQEMGRALLAELGV